MKVENICLLKPPVMIVSGLPPLSPDRVQDGLQRLFGEDALRAVGSRAGAVGRRGIAGEPAVPLTVLDLIHDRIEAVWRAVGGVARHLGLVDADENGLHVALELEALEHRLVGELVVAAGVLDRLLGAGNARDLIGDWQMLSSRTVDVVECRGVVAFEPAWRSTAARACVCHS